MNCRYVIWQLCDAWRVGGLANTALGRYRSNNISLYQPTIPSDLSAWQSAHTHNYPTVSLFNLAADPQETTNLAGEKPSLVEELLNEAEVLVAGAPAQPRGDRVHRTAPASPLQGSFRQLAASWTMNYPDQVVPFGPYLEDDVEITSLPVTGAGVLLHMTVILTKLFIVLVVIPILILHRIVKLF